MSDLNLDGMALAPNVAETIVSMAAQEVKGVASVGSYAVSGLRAMFGSKATPQGVELSIDDDDALHVSIRIEVYYGYVLPEVADAVRTAISEAVVGQIGIPVSEVDVYVDGIQFSE